MAAACGLGTTYLVSEYGNLFAFGVNYCNQLGSSTVVTSQVYPLFLRKESMFQGHGVLCVSAASEHAACITGDGAVWTWGWGGMGAAYHRRLGHGRDDDGETLSAPRFRDPGRLGPEVFDNAPAITVVCGRMCTMVLTTTGHVWTCEFHDNPEVQAMADNRFARIDPAIYETAIVRIACSSRHMLALNDQGTLFTWDNKIDGQPVKIPRSTFGDQGVLQMCGGVNSAVVVTANGVIWQVCPEMTPQRVGTDGDFDATDIQSMASYDGYTLVVTCDGRLYGWGRDRYARAPTMCTRATLMPDAAGFTNDNIASVCMGFFHRVIVKRDGTVYTWGEAYAYLTISFPNPVPLGLGYSLDEAPHYLGSGRCCNDTTQHTPRRLALARLCGQRIGSCSESPWMQRYCAAHLALGMQSHRQLAEGSYLRTCQVDVGSRHVED